MDSRQLIQARAAQTLLELVIDEMERAERREAVESEGEDSMRPLIVVGIPEQPHGEMPRLDFSPDLSARMAGHRVVIGVTESGLLVRLKNNLGPDIGATVVEYQ